MVKLADSELITWLSSSPDIAKLQELGILVVVRESGTLDGEPGALATTWGYQPGSTQGVQTPEQRAEQRKLNGWDLEPYMPQELGAWCDLSNPLMFAAVAAAVAVNPTLLILWHLACDGEEYSAGSNVQVAPEVSANGTFVISNSMVVSLVLKSKPDKLKKVPRGVITVDTPGQLKFARLQAYSSLQKYQLAAGSRRVAQILYSLLQSVEPEELAFDLYETAPTPFAGLLMPRAHLLSAAEALNLWQTRIGLALYAEVSLANAKADQFCGSVESLTNLSPSEFLCLLAPIVTPWPASGVGSSQFASLDVETPQSLAELLTGPLGPFKPPVGVKPEEWPVVVGDVPPAGSQWLFGRGVGLDNKAQIFPGGFWDVNPWRTQVAAVRALLAWRGSADGKLIEGASKRAGGADAIRLRGLRAILRWLADNFQDEAPVETAPMAGEVDLAHAAALKLAKLAMPGVAGALLPGPGSLIDADEGLEAKYLHGQHRQALQLAMLRALNIVVRPAVLPPLQFEVLWVKAAATAGTSIPIWLAPPVYIGVQTPWMWSTPEPQLQLILPNLGRMGDVWLWGPMFALRDLALGCLPVQTWWQLHPVREVDGKIHLEFNTDNPAATVQGMLAAQAKMGVTWRALLQPLNKAILQDFFDTALERFPKWPKRRVWLKSYCDKWAKLKGPPLGWLLPPAFYERWRLSFFELAWTGLCIPADFPTSAIAPVGIGPQWATGVKASAEFSKPANWGYADDLAQGRWAAVKWWQGLCAANLPMGQEPGLCDVVKVYLFNGAWPSLAQSPDIAARMSAFAAQLADG